MLRCWRRLFWASSIRASPNLCADSARRRLTEFWLLALAGYPLGLRFRFLDPSPEAPVGRIAQRVTADFLDENAMEKFANGLELVTYEFENVPVAATKFLAERVPVFPPPSTLEVAQDLSTGKELFHKFGI